MYIRLESNKPQIIAFKHLDPEQVQGHSGPELKWTLSDGKSLYTPVEFRDRIKALKVELGQKVKVERRGKTIYAAHVPDLRGGQTAARVLQNAPELGEPEASIPLSRPVHETTKQESLPPMRKTPQTALAIALQTAVSAAAIAEKHAESLGYSCRFSSSDIRAMGISVLIGMTRDGKVA
jgi:hypothetical protein